MEDYESILLVKPEVFVYKIPPRASNRGFRAADWNLTVPDWTGRLRLVSKSKDCVLKLEDKTSGELFAKCPIDKYPGIAIESVTDSSRYFVLRIQDDSGRSAFIGMGFADRGDSFDLNVSLQDHFKWVEKTEEIEQEEKGEGSGSKPQLDLSFKEGQTITINIGQKKGSGVSRPKPKATSSGILPPPPSSGIRLAPPPGGSKVASVPSSVPSPPQPSPVTNSAANGNNLDLLLDIGNDVAASPSIPAGTVKAANADLWGDFENA